MLTLPAVPMFSGAHLSGPVPVELAPIGLAVIIMLASAFFAAVSVILVYHWRRFPYEQEVFHRVERLYFFVSFVLLGLAITCTFL
jgi:hypothetical protein